MRRGSPRRIAPGNRAISSERQSGTSFFKVIILFLRVLVVLVQVAAFKSRIAHVPGSSDSDFNRTLFNLLLTLSTKPLLKDSVG